MTAQPELPLGCAHRSEVEFVDAHGRYRWCPWCGTETPVGKQRP